MKKFSKNQKLLIVVPIVIITFLAGTVLANLVFNFLDF